MYKLARWAPQDRSGTVNWLLQELGVPFEVQNFDYEKDSKDPEFRKLHPLGAVPVLFDLERGFHMFESGAICLYLAQKHSNASDLLPTLGSRDYAACLQWMFFTYAEIVPCEMEYWGIPKDDPRRAERVAAVETKFRKCLGPLERRLAEGGPFLLGAQFSVADIPLAHSLHWMRDFEVAKEFPQLGKYVERMKSRPAALRAGLFA